MVDNSQAHSLLSSLKNVILGRDDTLKLVITGLLADGHVLIEDFPGSGKTTLAKTLGKLITKSAHASEISPFHRIQFTPDMLPGDVLGVHIFETHSSQFRFVKGPIFSHVILADEINRAGPKVQAAFLECMAEKQVTIENSTFALHDLFFVIATQNPLDFAGTYALPFAQLDRFLLKIPMSYVDKATELKILDEHDTISRNTQIVSPVCTADDIVELRKAVKNVFVSESIKKCIVDIVQTSRQHDQVEIGVSTRAALSLQSAYKAWAFLDGRDFVTEDDVAFITPFVLVHRLRLKAKQRSELDSIKEFISPFLEKLIRNAF
jgi:MoxR-like ATPase